MTQTFDSGYEAPTAQAPATVGQESPAEALGARLRGEFEDAARLRKPYEDEWVKSLRQFKGIYDPEVLRHIDPNKCKLFLRVTKIKCEAIKARVMDLLFPANGQRNWDIQPTPDAKVNEATLQNAVNMIVMSGQQHPNSIDMEKLEQEVAIAACEAMATEIEDQLGEVPGRVSYRQTCTNMVAQAVRYGTGVLKGPLVEERIRQAYKPNPATGKWERQAVSDGYWPFYEFVPVWAVFPDLSAADKSQLQFVWQEHLMTVKDLQALRRQPYFDGQAIKDYIVSKRDGDASPKDYETEIRRLSEEEVSPDLKGRYRVLERWGYLTGQDLADAGVQLPEEQFGDVFSSNLWILGDKVIKAVINPLDGLDFPYYFFHFDKDESSFFGEGVPRAMRDCQQGINASARMLIDNAAIASGPQVGINARALASGQDPTAIYPWKVWLFDRAEDMKQSMHVWDLPMHTSEITGLLQLFNNFTDEITTPRYMHGDEKVSGAGSTMGGLSMLMGAANITLKDLVKQFDDSVTTPFIGAMYAWNMQWSDKEAIKGDYDVKATGSTSLIAKEVRAQQYQSVFNITADPRFQGRVKDQELLEHFFRDIDMPTHLIRTEQEFQQFQQQQMQMQAKAQTDAMVQSLMEQALTAGVDEKTAFASIVAQIGGAQPQQQPPQAGAPND